MGRGILRPSNGDGAERFVERVRKSRKPVAALLMDQSIAAGVGNIYRAELLFRARVNPFAAGKDVAEATLKGMWSDAGLLMRAGMVDRRIVTTLPHDRPGGGEEKVLKQEAHYVYRRHGKECFVCGTAVLKREMEARNLYWCPNCQQDGRPG
jgi:endonuclease-8